MSTPDIQYFGTSGTWVKPEGAVRVDIVLRGGDGGEATATTGGGGGGASHIGYHVPAASASQHGAANSGHGTLSVMSFNAMDLPGTVEVTVGKGERPGGRDGYALIVTHLAETGGGTRPWYARSTGSRGHSTSPGRKAFHER